MIAWAWFVDVLEIPLEYLRGVMKKKTNIYVNL